MVVHRWSGVVHVVSILEFDTKFGIDTGSTLAVHPEISFLCSGSKLGMVVGRRSGVVHVVSILQFDTKFGIDTGSDRVFFDGPP